MSEKSRDNWKAWAIGGIWLGTGLSAFGAGFGAIIVAFFAMLATDSISEAK